MASNHHHAIVQSTPMLTLNQPLFGEVQPRKLVKPQRIYRPGLEPKWLKEQQEINEEEDSSDEEDFMHEDRFQQRNRPFHIDQLKAETTKGDDDDEDGVDLDGDREIAEPEIISTRQDIKGIKLEDSSPRDLTKTEEELEKLKAEIIEIDLRDLKIPEAAHKEDLEQVEDDIDDRRARIRRKIKMKQETDDVKPTEQLPQRQDGEGESSDEGSDGSSESDSDSEFEEYPNTSRDIFMAKFVPKNHRETTKSKKDKEIEEEEQKRKEEELREQRETIARQMVIDAVRADDVALNRDSSDDEMPDDDDDDDTEQFEQWKLRELRRMKRDADARTKAEEEALDTERRRNMTDREREDDALRYRREHPEEYRSQKRKGKIKFLQKYYHRGAFYQDGDLVDSKIMSRDFTAATGDDKWVDRQKLPQVMQVKNFGLASRTKYTHLVDQDTTRPDENPWIQSSHSERFRLGGMSTMDRPSKRMRRDMHGGYNQYADYNQ